MNEDCEEEICGVSDAIDGNGAYDMERSNEESQACKEIGEGMEIPALIYCLTETEDLIFKPGGQY